MFTWEKLLVNVWTEVEKADSKINMGKNVYKMCSELILAIAVYWWSFSQTVGIRLSPPKSAPEIINRTVYGIVI